MRIDVAIASARLPVLSDFLLCCCWYFFSCMHTLIYSHDSGERADTR